ncbi:hypothetical protein [Massilia sp. Dwa41.01b]|uniref:hypothetical protein n=1 Tax=Massilia sp. Dwa41.01b TaxID=2709302 RepID=UPI001E344697|nr:hypothetical protein [Massilia sp. Dwa41.01b]
MIETLLSRSVRRLFAGSGAIGLALIATPGAQARKRPSGRSRVVVTGSNIRRAEAETASSVLTVNRADIERSGKSTVSELLQTPAVDNRARCRPPSATASPPAPRASRCAAWVPRPPWCCSTAAAWRRMAWPTTARKSSPT